MAKNKTETTETEETDATISTESTEMMTDGILTAMSKTRYRGDAILTTLPNESVDDKKAIYNALNGKSKSLSDNLGQSIKVTDYIVERGTVKDKQSGELRIVARLTLISIDGTKYFSAANSILGAFDRIFSFFGNGPWKDGIEIIVSGAKLANGNQWFTVEVV